MTTRDEFRTMEVKRMNEQLRHALIQWLMWNDPNGCYDDIDTRAEFGRISTLPELLESALYQLQD